MYMERGFAVVSLLSFNGEHGAGSLAMVKVESFHLTEAAANALCPANADEPCGRFSYSVKGALRDPYTPGAIFFDTPIRWSR